MNITVGQTVSYSVASVQVKNVLISKGSDGKLRIMAPYAWLDSANVVLRTGTNVYTEAQLTTALGSNAPSAIALMGSLVPSTGTSGNCSILLGDSVTAIKGYSGRDDAGKGKWFSTTLDAAAFATAISPMTVDQLKAMIQAFTATVFT